MFVTLTLNPAIDCTLTVRDPLRVGAVHSVVSETRIPGGKGVNVAKAIAGADARVVAGGILGNAETGFFTETLAAAGVACDFLPVPFPTRSNLMLSDGRGGEIKLNRYGFPDLPFDLPNLTEYCRSLARRGDVMILSGSLPSDFPANLYATLTRLFKEEGKIVVLDVAGEALRTGIGAGPDLIKPNRSEFAGLTGPLPEDRHGLAALLREWSARHGAVILSDGAAGAWFAFGARLLYAEAPRVQAVDTTGAGDFLLGQFCAEYFATPGRDLSPECIRSALAAGSACVELQGVPPVSRSRVKELAEAVVIHEM